MEELSHKSGHNLLCIKGVMGKGKVGPRVRLFNWGTADFIGSEKCQLGAATRRKKKQQVRGKGG